MDREEEQEKQDKQDKQDPKDGENKAKIRMGRIGKKKDNPTPNQPQ